MSLGGGVVALLIAALLLTAISCRQAAVIVPYPPLVNPGVPGSESNPYRISSAEDLKALRSADTEGVYYELTGDIVLTEEFDPIPVFKGNLIGNGHVIRGLRVAEYSTAEEYEAAGGYVMDGKRTFSAFIQSLDGGVISGLSFEDYEIPAPPVYSSDTNQIYMAVVAGVISNGAVIENVTVGEGEIVSPVRAAGVVGYVKNTDKPDAVNVIRNTENNADVTTTLTTESTYGTAGGIVSTTADSLLLISDSHNHGTVTGYVAGGIAGDIQNSRLSGKADDGTLINGTLITGGSSNSGRIRGIEYAGGIAGTFWNDAAADIISASNSGTVECYIPDGASAPVSGFVKLGGIIGSSVNFADDASKRAAHLIKDCVNTGNVMNEESAVDAYIGGIIGSTVRGHVTIEDCYMESGTLKTVRGPQKAVSSSETDISIAEVTVGGIIGKTEGNQNVIRDSYAYPAVVYDVPEGYRSGSIAGYFDSASFGTGGYLLDDGTEADWTNEAHIEAMMNEVTFSNPAEVKNPFGILTMRSYSRAVRATNIHAETLYIGGASPYVSDESEQAWVEGKSIYDLSGCVVNELHRDLDFESRGGGLPQTSVLRGVDINTMIIDEDTQDAPQYAPVTLYYEIDDSFELVNNASDHFRLNINGTLYEENSASITV